MTAVSPMRALSTTISFTVSPFASSVLVSIICPTWTGAFRSV